jgi:SH3 domain protein
VNNYKNQSIRFIAISLVALSSLLATAPSLAKTQYVSDELKVPLRSGSSDEHRILKFIRSGTALTILDVAGDYTQVKTSEGKKGWVLTKHVMDMPSGRDRLVSVNEKLEKSKQKIKKLEDTIAELKSGVSQLKNEKGLLQSERTNLTNSLDDMRITAASPLAMSKKNKQLMKELEKLNANEAMLEKDNQQLRSNVTQEWFLIGGAVTIGSLILGILLTRINWRRKRDSWGDSF